MALNIVYFGGAIVILALINPAFSVQCFECQTEIGKNSTCETNVWASKTNQTCTLGFVCSKYLIKIGNTTTLYRKCAAPDLCAVQKAASEGQMNQDNGNVVGSINQTIISCYTCNDTLCNSVSLPTLNVALFGVLLTGLVALFA